MSLSKYQELDEGVRGMLNKAMDPALATVSSPQEAGGRYGTSDITTQDKKLM